MEIVTTDVLVIGAGGAGLQAAIAARETGVEVAVVSKTPLGKTTCTYLAAGVFTLASEGFSKADHLRVTLQSGKGINERKLAEILVDEAPDRIRELERIGLVGGWKRGGFFISGKAPAWGAPLTRLLADAVRKQGVSAVAWVTILRIIVQDGKAVGALGYDFRAGRWMAFLAKAVILAMGGAAALYRRHDNPIRMTGDGYALAYHAGCSLRDMEFVQFMPPGLAEPGKPMVLIVGSLCDNGKVINSQGEDILAKYQITERPVNAKARDTFALAIFREELEGREVFLDLRSLPAEAWAKDPVAQSQRPFLMGNLAAAERPIRISPMGHFFMGGVAIDAQGSTEIPGLFAAGEVAGGLHGANRLGGNALDEILVFGRRAGRAAAEWAKTQGWRDGEESLAQQQMKALESSRSGPAGPFRPRMIRQMLSEILWKEGGIFRHGNGLRWALRTLTQMKQEDLSRVRPETPKESLEKMELENAFLVAEMTLRGAFMREESRGAHYRSDFPQTEDPRWKGNIFIKKSGKGMELTFRSL